MKNKEKILNFEKLLKILDILSEYIDENNEIKPEFFEKIEPITQCLSIFSAVPENEIDTKNVLQMVMDFDNYIKTHEILEANKMIKRFRMIQ
jgi:hypothetical protein